MSVTLAEVKAGKCRWVFGEPNGAATRMCGRQAQVGLSWCPAHYKKAHAKNQKIAKAKMNWYAAAAGKP